MTATDHRSALDEARTDAAHCTNCDLYQHATQTVFGEGPVPARMVLVGEQPGDREDRAGHPFVGPAGAVLDRALERAGIARADVFLTNAVKHFRFEQRGKRRIHQKPNTTQVVACRPWLDIELDLVDPAVLVCLGVTAASSVFGRAITLRRVRGTVHQLGGRQVVATIHPSAVLRADDDQRDAELDGLVADLGLAARSAG